MKPRTKQEILHRRMSKIEGKATHFFKPSEKDLLIKGSDEKEEKKLLLKHLVRLDKNSDDKIKSEPQEDGNISPSSGSSTGCYENLLNHDL